MFWEIDKVILTLGLEKQLIKLRKQQQRLIRKTRLLGIKLKLTITMNYKTEERLTTQSMKENRAVKQILAM